VLDVLENKEVSTATTGSTAGSRIQKKYRQYHVVSTVKQNRSDRYSSYDEVSRRIPILTEMIALIESTWGIGKSAASLSQCTNPCRKHINEESQLQ